MAEQAGAPPHFHRTRYPLPEALDAMTGDETVCRYCGISYLLHRELQKLRDQLHASEQKLRTATLAIDQGESFLRDKFSVEIPEIGRQVATIRAQLALSKSETGAQLADFRNVCASFVQRALAAVKMSSSAAAAGSQAEVATLERLREEEGRAHRAEVRVLEVKVGKALQGQMAMEERVKAVRAEESKKFYRKLQENQENFEKLQQQLREEFAMKTEERQRARLEAEEQQRARLEAEEQQRARLEAEEQQRTRLKAEEQQRARLEAEEQQRARLEAELSAATRRAEELERSRGREIAAESEWHVEQARKEQQLGLQMQMLRREREAVEGKLAQATEQVNSLQKIVQRECAERLELTESLERARQELLLMKLKRPSASDSDRKFSQPLPAPKSARDQDVAVQRQRIAAVIQQR